MQPTTSTNPNYNSNHSFHPGQHVIAGGRLATVKSICATGAVNVVTDGGALLTFLDGVSPVVEQVAQ